MSAAPGNNLHTRLPHTWRKFNVPEPEIPPCQARPDRERVLGNYKRSVRAPADIHIGLRTSVQGTASCARNCWTPGAQLPTWYLKQDDAPDRPKPGALDDLLSPAARTERRVNAGAPAPNYGYSDDGIRHVSARFSYFCPPGSESPSGPTFSYPFTHHLNGQAAPSRHAPQEEESAE
eukprot:TRINITY_DN20561_c0_g1_i1.p1 TRINITY_DN20561_c0_g1~~TRINITY_DN20561_c0_g1_i1.p1  ORF type:complete len:177 (-),score=7.04 TRINITY_DN20561_c0_g1_i1:169-699(-)